MTLVAGARLGPYEIVGLIGSGGMGEVYRARDPRLGRDVAIKVLPASVSDQPDRLRRFEVEARAASALNHPNVLAVFDIGQHEGTPYVVAELLEGETLDERMRSPLPLRKALDFAAQMARGLAAAHEKGIVHRDIKPANVFVTKDGRVKILDFGLAKLVLPEPEGGDTRTREADPGTTPGTILGTVGYMSPEQVRGLPADHRSDIFSLGAILFEMAAGRRAFQGETAPETMTLILRNDPLDSEAARGLPPGVGRVVRRCLQKDPSERFQSTQDLAFDLTSLTEASSTAQGHAAVATRGRPALWKIAGFVLLAAAAAGIFLAGRWRRASPAIPSYHQLTSRQGVVWSAQFGPDGDTIVYSAEWPGRPMEIFSTWGKSATSRSLGLTDARILAVSRQGELAIALRPYLTAFGTHRGTLARVPMAGGTPRELMEDVQDADWSPDGQALAVIRWVENRCRLEYPLGTVVYEPVAPAWLSHLSVSARGDTLAFAEHAVPGDLGGVVALLPVGGERRTVSGPFVALLGLGWSPGDEGILFFGTRKGAEGGGVYRTSTTGQERQVAGVPGTIDILDVGRTGRVAASRRLVSTSITALAPGSSHEQDLSESDYSFISDLSADGTTLLGTSETPSADADMFLRRIDGTPSVNLGKGDALALSRDGRWVLARVPGEPEKLLVLPTGAGDARELPRGEIDHFFHGDWFPGARTVLFSATTRGSRPRVFAQDVAGGAPRVISPEGYSLPPLGSSISPDGQRVLVLGPDQAPLLFRIEGTGEPVPVPGLEAGDVPVAWTIDGRGVYFYSTGEDAARLQQADLETGKVTLVRERLAARPSGMIGDFRILVSEDGRTSVLSYSRIRGDLFLIENLR